MVKCIAVLLLLLFFSRGRGRVEKRERDIVWCLWCGMFVGGIVVGSGGGGDGSDDLSCTSWMMKFEL